MSDTIRLNCTPILTASAGKPSRLKIKAYSGGIMTVADFGPVVIDLDGLTLPDSVPCLGDHRNELNAVIGGGKPEIRNGELFVVVTLADAPAADLVRELVAADSRPGASVGVKPGKTRRVKEGVTVRVNGRTFTAPRGGLTVLETGTLLEISVVPIAADPNTRVKLAASSAKGKHMAIENDPTTPDGGDVLTAERERTEAVCEAAERFPTIRGQAIREGWTLQKTQLECLRAGRPDVDNRHGSGQVSGYAKTEEVLAAGFLLRAGRSDVAEKHIGPAACQQAETMRLNVSPLSESCCMALRAERRDVPHGQHEMLRAAFSTMSLPIALGLSANKLALDAYRNSPASWRSFCKIASLKDFKEHSMIRIHWGGQFQRVAAGGELKHGTIGEETFRLTGHTFGEILKIDRTSIINDDLGAFTGTAEALGRAAARSVSDLVFECLLKNLEPDGTTPFFTEGRGNLLTGAGTALGLDALAAAVSDMVSRTDKDGRIIDLRPAVLLVPPELDIAAREVLTSQQTARYVSSGAGGDRLPTGNPMFGQVELCVEARLSNSGFANNSDASWYLFSRPSDGCVVLGFLGGVEAPVIEQVDLEADVLGVGFRGFLDAGVSLADFRCGTMAAGS